MDEFLKNFSKSGRSEGGERARMKQGYLCKGIWRGARAWGTLVSRLKPISRALCAARC